MTVADDDHLAWRNLVVQWHIDRGMPDCGCADDTPDHRLCPASVAWADARYAERPDPALAGPVDAWNHDVWKAAWGYNATLIAADTDYRLPTPPKGTAWLATRVLVGGRCAVDLTLYRPDKCAFLARARVDAEPSTVQARAATMLQGLV